MTRRYLSATEAAQELGIAQATLYAYVSRGLIHSEPAEAGNGGSHSRARRYRAEDVRRLQERQAQRHDPARAAATALSWGSAVLESAITLIHDGRLYYRGHDALALAGSHSIEEVAALLWTGALDHSLDWPSDGPPRSPLTLDAALPAIERFQLLLPRLQAADPRAYDLHPRSLPRAGARILRSLVCEAAGGSPVAGGIAATLQRQWAPTQPAAAALLNAALVLSADHELNVSSFTVRCVASAGAPLYAAVLGGLSALQGVKHGGVSRRVEALLHEVGQPGAARDVLRSRLRRGEPIPGFGHRLYPEGDPRAALLLRLTRDAFPGSEAVRLLDALQAAGRELLDEGPNIDLGLAGLTRALGLPDGTALTLMALGRAAGWIAHALEQYQSDQLIRPRARYVGVEPEAPGGGAAS
ncbi:MAG TPA: citrate synthase family protein [Thermomicrobiaceae bacterium]|nr:citrate synthase family protein [Thermomicrobiaceae bacterium]